MLTKNLLEVRKRKPHISPIYRDVEENVGIAETVIDAYQEGVKKEDIYNTVSELEDHDNFKFLRGLSKLLERRSEFATDAPVDPKDLRISLFERGYVVDPDERDKIVEEVANEYGVTPDDAEDAFWADRDEKQVLVSPPDIDPDELIKQYNLSLTQTLLFDALEFEFKVSDNYQEIFRNIKYLGLMYNVDPELKVNVTGPASLFKKTRKYGTSLAKLLPSIMKAENWWVMAKVETNVRGESKVYDFTLDSDEDYRFPDADESNQEIDYDSEVEEEFASSVESLADGWEIKREPTILRAGNKVMIPDFSFKRGSDEFYVEVVGFWTPEYLEEKIDKIRDLESDAPILLAVNEDLKCTKEDFGNADEVFFYDRKIPVKPVVQRMKEIEKKAIETDLRRLEKREFEIDSEDVTDLTRVAEEEGVEADALIQYLDENTEGVVTNMRYVPPSVIQDIKRDIEDLDTTLLSEINDALEEYGVDQEILEELGYTIKWTSLNQDEVRIEKN